MEVNHPRVSQSLRSQSSSQDLIPLGLPASWSQNLLPNEVLISETTCVRVLQRNRTHRT